MKRRFVAVGLAAATALSLSVAPAQAQNNWTSSYNDFFGQNGASSKRMGQAARKGDLAAVARIQKEIYEARANMDGSIKNDRANGYKYGTTFDILLGTGVAAALLAILGGAAQQQGLIKLPF